MKNVKTYESFLDKFREEKAGTELIPEPEENDIRGKKIGRISELDELDGKVLLDVDSGLQLYINSMDNYLELIDPEGNEGSGKVIDTYSIPEPGKMAPLDEDEEPDEDGNYSTGVYLEDSLSYLEFIEDDRVINTFSLRDAEDVTDVFNVNESKLQEDYREFFTNLLKIYGVKSPAEFKNKPELSKKFYNDIKKGWTKGKGLSEYGKKLMKSEKLNESIITFDDIDEGSEQERRYNKFIEKYNMLVSEYELGLGVSNGKLSILDINNPDIMIVKSDDDLTLKF